MRYVCRAVLANVTAVAPLLRLRIFALLFAIVRAVLAFYIECRTLHRLNLLSSGYLEGNMLAERSAASCGGHIKGTHQTWLSIEGS